jgi:hypothetical protein
MDMEEHKFYISINCDTKLHYPNEKLSHTHCTCLNENGEMAHHDYFDATCPIQYGLIMSHAICCANHKNCFEGHIGFWNNTFKFCAIQFSDTNESNRKKNVRLMIPLFTNYIRWHHASETNLIVPHCLRSRFTKMGGIQIIIQSYVLHTIFILKQHLVADAVFNIILLIQSLFK